MYFLRQPRRRRHGSSFTLPGFFFLFRVPHPKRGPTVFFVFFILIIRLGSLVSVSTAKPPFHAGKHASNGNSQNKQAVVITWWPGVS